ncbi:uncharacterized protein F4822DRAFT_435339 [Hypoxylon trugodes]|uniref:uncharacterized protein n=1 Tax=Hypoxylon trugodes TaxID=326681 RepID=UPI00218FF258|nr:uncharacterized protein F4822DRAFT_435339 [Hypoxylon trugodes]KAI1382664.1 hypothetical protein F4822DRAFT_435339 [Hypoxylon trugodes]
MGEYFDDSISHDAQIKKLSIEELDNQHPELFVRALDRVMSTDLAKLTCAEIVDGLPLIDTVNENGGGGLSGFHPLYDMHENLCEGVMEQTEEIRKNFDPKVLQFDSRSASPGLRAFRMRLIEMIAVAVHQVAVVLFQPDTSLHKDDGITTWAPPKDDTIFWEFSHEWYKDYKQYPDGVADLVGYWAESRILGGVVLFDRGTPTRKLDPDAVFSHADREETTYRIYRLLDGQKQKMLDFLLLDSPTQNPCPILASLENVFRVDPEEDIEDTGVYRDIWERKPLPIWCSDYRLRDVWDKFDFPLRHDWEEARGRCSDRRNRPEPE